MAVKGLIPQLAERGKIKIGMKGKETTSSKGKTFSQPLKLDHFLITTMQRDATGNLIKDLPLMQKLNPNGDKLVEIPVRLLYDDIDLNFLTRYACYKGNRCWCSGDGERAQRLNGTSQYQPVACPCERLNPYYEQQDKCKTLGTLQALIEGTDRIGGVWKFRTTSFNSVNAILSSLALIQTITGGILAGIPLKMVLSPKTVTVPSTGQNMTVYVVSLEYRGSEQELAEIGYNTAKRRIDNKIRMEGIEDQARKLLVGPQEESLDEQQETGEEFYPEAIICDSPQEDPEVATNFWDLVNGAADHPGMDGDEVFNLFFNETARAMQKSPYDTMVAAMEDFSGFWQAWERWSAKNHPAESEQETTTSSDAPGETITGTPDQNHAPVQENKEMGHDGKDSGGNKGPTQAQITILKKEASRVSLSEADICKKMGVSSYEALTPDEYSEALLWLKNVKS